VFSRSAGAPLVGGNSVRILRDARENYPAWEAAIRGARATIHVEMYIIHRDQTGRDFIELLAERARAGIKVRLIYDWFGCGWGPVFGLFRPLLKAGGEVRVFNPPRLVAALGWTTRNHRKYIAVDSRVAFVAGLCVGRAWVGRPEKHQDPWRDTGMEIVGPAVAQAEHGFAESWRMCGGSIHAASLPDEEDVPAAGSVNVRLIYTEPFSAAMLRTDLLVSAMARHRLWIADAYFVAHGPYVSALQHAAFDGVDVRLLLPQGSDVGWTVPVARTLYRTLIESGVRIYEWNGTMIHAKTAVADSRWARIGSTNLNLNSWVGNWELDVAVEDADIARLMESHYEEDLANATEIVVAGRHSRPVGTRGVRRRGRARRTARRALRTVTGVGHSIGAAVMGSRRLEEWEATPLLTVGGILAVLTGLSLWHPHVVSWPFAVIAAWVSFSFLTEAVRLLRRPRS
jgi:phosphatidylserine/phosphatidylglycerophosphate/cardiolipin synthase-like enzyme